MPVKFSALSLALWILPIISRTALQQVDVVVVDGFFIHGRRRRPHHRLRPPLMRKSGMFQLFEGQSNNGAYLSSDEIRSRIQERLALLREKDRRAKAVDEKDLKIVHEDKDIIVVEKPAGVLCVPSEPGVHSLAQTVYEYCTKKQIGETSSNATSSMDQMVVHRLGFDTSGLLVFAKTADAVRGMHTLFRTRKITRQYEVLVVGHVQQDQGFINLPLMRDYEYPPYMRISTDQHQRNLVGLDPTIVGKKLLEAPKTSLTHYQVLKREYWQGNAELPVTRMTLTSMTGRTHQLNVHCAASGHPIVRDTVYGYQGSAASNGGLSESELPKDRASVELQRAVAAAAADSNMCVHAKLIRFQHPTTGEEVEFRSSPPF